MHKLSRRFGLALAAAGLAVAALARAETAAPPARLTPVGVAELAALLEAQRGQVVLVNFWATWCRPCLKEIPELTALEARLGARGFVLLPVSLDEPADREAVVLPFLDKWFPGFRSYIRTTPDMDSLVSVVDRAWNEVLPTSYVLDREGRVAARLQGGKPAEEFEAAIRPLLD